jgi:hypothetical protein
VFVPRAHDDIGNRRSLQKPVQRNLRIGIVGFRGDFVESVDNLVEIFLTGFARPNSELVLTVPVRNVALLEARRGCVCRRSMQLSARRLALATSLLPRP